MSAAGRWSLSGAFTPVVPWPAAGSVDAHVRGEQVRAVFQQAFVAQLLSLLVAGLVAATLWRVGDHGAILLWLAALGAVTLARMGMVVAFRRRDPPPDRMARWERAFVITLAGTSLAWGLGGALVAPRASVVHEAVVYFFLLGIAGAALASYAAHAVACMVSVCCLLVPATVAFAAQDVLELRVMATGGAVFLVASVRATRIFGFFLHRSFQLSWELQQAYGRARDMARTDALTRLNNRRAFLELGVRALDQAQRYRRPLSVLMFDIDHFKTINDTFGHAAGDRVLVAVAEVLRRTARAADVPGRLGGEEFAVLLPETRSAEAAALAERLRRELAAAEVAADGTVIRFTCSLGVAEGSDDVRSIDTLLNRADRALYRAKRKGRNRVSTEALPPGSPPALGAEIARPGEGTLM